MLLVLVPHTRTGLTPTMVAIAGLSCTQASLVHKQPYTHYGSHRRLIVYTGKLSTSTGYTEHNTRTPY